ncbi:DUF3085 domain-containing protein [Cupriavidus pampae]|uniref:DUF3085 domain-containing protein n=1 Tax=Cupriavidus pampae TaxID=659251 RepID=A0ABN7ZM29_9BURK|nr:DUF3085 domain-containing protein [Cupriavidus pampae]CAG9186075.1 hypothetical protein LMG32289_06248 [Cupriavidus pampae]
MPQITLSRTQVASLVAFCDAAGSSTFFIAKDEGAYVGYSTGATPDKQCIFYFKGCNPAKDADFYENTLRMFGGDDFGEHMQLSDLRKALEDPAMKTVRIKLTTTSIRMEAFS